MRGPLPLDDHDFANIRAQVMAKIEKPPRAPLVWQVAFASLVLAVLSIVVGRQPAVRPSSAASPHLLPLTREKEAVIAPLPRQRERVALSEAKGRVRVAHHRKPAPQKVARMEIQTADPDVRIIWITN